MAYWALFAIPVLVFCVCFVVFYLLRIYPKPRRKSREENDDEHVGTSGEQELPDHWLEMEILGLAEERLAEQLQDTESAQGEDINGEPLPELDNTEYDNADFDEARENAGPTLAAPARFFHRPFPLIKWDIIPILIISAVYAIVAFWGLGSRDTPESFAVFEGFEASAVMELPIDTIPDKLSYYTGLGTGKYEISGSNDGIAWSHVMDVEQKYSELLKWQTAVFPEGTPAVKFIKLTAKNSPLYLGEATVFDAKGDRVMALAADDLAEKLLDERELPIISTSYLYNSYFDEIYHARTAYEHILNIYPYEVSHPPLGKITIGIGIRIFGMNPFGWRFMGTLFGILMLPIMYIIIKNMFGKMLVATCGTLLFAFDFMHFVQTRIATIDTYGVFFIMLMFYFMYRYFVQDYDTAFRKTLPPLFLSGLFFGLGAASKWTVIYGGAGLLAIYVIRQVLRGRYYAKLGRRDGHRKYLYKTLAVSAVFFIIVPAAIYILSYIPYGLAKGMSIGEGMLWKPEYLKLVWDNQTFMYSYHGGLVATHPYSSPWWKWILDLRPILYFLQSFDDGTKSAFAAFGNPIVWWTGIGAIISLVIAALKRRDKLALIIVIGYFAQLIPWILISRIAFIYHYFPNVIFIVLGISYMFNDLCESRRSKLSRAVPLFTAAALLLFAAFYPALTGVRVDAGYSDTFLRWFNGMWPF